MSFLTNIRINQQKTQVKLVDLITPELINKKIHIWEGFLGIIIMLGTLSSWLLGVLFRDSWIAFCYSVFLCQTQKSNRKLFLSMGTGAEMEFCFHWRPLEPRPGRSSIATDAWRLVVERDGPFGLSSRLCHAPGNKFLMNFWMTTYLLTTTDHKFKVVNFY